MEDVTYITIWLLSISAMDIRSRRVPIWLFVPGGGLALMILLDQFEKGTMEYFDMFTGMLPGVFLLLIAFVTKKAGYGDGIAILFVGMISGGGKSLWIFCISLFLISICSAVLLLFRKVRRNSQIPYLPFLTVTWLLLLYTGG